MPPPEADAAPDADLGPDVAAPEPTWSLDVWRRSTGAFVYGMTFTAPVDADPAELAAGACRHAAAEYGGAPGDYISSRPLCIPDFDSDPGA